MDIQQIKYFLEVVKTENFSEAAANLYTTQSSVSKNIKALEKELNISLFDRGKRKIRLTEIGQLVAADATLILNSYEKMMYTVDNYKKTQLDTLSIGSIPVMAQYNITGLLADFQNANPNIDLSITEYEGILLLDKIKNRELDFAFMRKENLDSDTDYFPIFEDYLGVILPKSHLLATRDSVSLAELKHENILLLNQETLLYDKIIDLCRQNEFNPKISYTGTRIENILELVGKEQGISIMMMHAAEYIHNPNVVILPLKENYKSTIVLVRCKSGHLSHSASRFLSYIQTHQ